MLKWTSKSSINTDSGTGDRAVRTDPWNETEAVRHSIRSVDGTVLFGSLAPHASLDTPPNLSAKEMDVSRSEPGPLGGQATEHPETETVDRGRMSGVGGSGRTQNLPPQHEQVIASTPSSPLVRAGCDRPDSLARSRSLSRLGSPISSTSSVGIPKKGILSKVKKLFRRSRGGGEGKERRSVSQPPSPKTEEKPQTSLPQSQDRAGPCSPQGSKHRRPGAAPSSTRLTRRLDSRRSQRKKMTAAEMDTPKTDDAPRNAVTMAEMDTRKTDDAPRNVMADGCYLDDDMVNSAPRFIDTPSFGEKLCELGDPPLSQERPWPLTFETFKRATPASCSSGGTSASRPSPPSGKPPPFAQRTQGEYHVSNHQDLCPAQSGVKGQEVEDLESVGREWPINSVEVKSHRFVTVDCSNKNQRVKSELTQSLTEPTPVVHPIHHTLSETLVPSHERVPARPRSSYSRISLTHAQGGTTPPNQHHARPPWRDTRDSQPSGDVAITTTQSHAHPLWRDKRDSQPSGDVAITTTQSHAHPLWRDKRDSQPSGDVAITTTQSHAHPLWRDTRDSQPSGDVAITTTQSHAHPQWRDTHDSQPSGDVAITTTQSHAHPLWRDKRDSQPRGDVAITASTSSLLQFGDSLVAMLETRQMQEGHNFVEESHIRHAQTCRGNRFNQNGRSWEGSSDSDKEQFKAGPKPSSESLNLKRSATEMRSMLCGDQIVAALEANEFQCTLGADPQQTLGSRRSSPSPVESDSHNTKDLWFDLKHTENLDLSYDAREGSASTSPKSRTLQQGQTDTGAPEIKDVQGQDTMHETDENIGSEHARISPTTSPRHFVTTGASISPGHPPHSKSSSSRDAPDGLSERAKNNNNGHGVFHKAWSCSRGDATDTLTGGGGGGGGGRYGKEFSILDVKSISPGDCLVNVARQDELSLGAAGVGQKASSPQRVRSIVNQLEEKIKRKEEHAVARPSRRGDGEAVKLSPGIYKEDFRSGDQSPNLFAVKEEDAVKDAWHKRSRKNKVEGTFVINTTVDQNKEDKQMSFQSADSRKGLDSNEDGGEQVGSELSLAGTVSPLSDVATYRYCHYDQGDDGSSSSDTRSICSDTFEAASAKSVSAYNKKTVAVEATASHSDVENNGVVRSPTDLSFLTACSGDDTEVKSASARPEISADFVPDIMESHKRRLATDGSSESLQCQGITDVTPLCPLVEVNSSSVDSGATAEQSQQDTNDRCKKDAALHTSQDPETQIELATEPSLKRGKESASTRESILITAHKPPSPVKKSVSFKLDMKSPATSTSPSSCTDDAAIYETVPPPKLPRADAVVSVSQQEMVSNASLTDPSIVTDDSAVMSGASDFPDEDVAVSYAPVHGDSDVAAAPASKPSPVKSDPLSSLSGDELSWCGNNSFTELHFIDVMADSNPRHQALGPGPSSCPQDAPDLDHLEAKEEEHIEADGFRIKRQGSQNSADCEKTSAGVERQHANNITSALSARTQLQSTGNTRREVAGPDTKPTMYSRREKETVMMDQETYLKRASHNKSEVQPEAEPSDSGNSLAHTYNVNRATSPPAGAQVDGPGQDEDIDELVMDVDASSALSDLVDQLDSSEHSSIKGESTVDVHTTSPPVESNTKSWKSSAASPHVPFWERVRAQRSDSFVLPQTHSTQQRRSVPKPIDDVKISTRPQSQHAAKRNSLTSLRKRGRIEKENREQNSKRRSFKYLSAKEEGSDDVDIHEEEARKNINFKDAPKEAQTGRISLQTTSSRWQDKDARQLPQLAEGKNVSRRDAPSPPHTRDSMTNRDNESRPSLQRSADHSEAAVRKSNVTEMLSKRPCLTPPAANLPETLNKAIGERRSCFLSSTPRFLQTTHTLAGEKRQTLPVIPERDTFFDRNNRSPLAEDEPDTKHRHSSGSDVDDPREDGARDEKNIVMTQTSPLSWRPSTDDSDQNESGESRNSSPGWRESRGLDLASADSSDCSGERPICGANSGISLHTRPGRGRGCRQRSPSSRSSDGSDASSLGDYTHSVSSSPGSRLGHVTTADSHLGHVIVPDIRLGQMTTPGRHLDHVGTPASYLGHVTTADSRLGHVTTVDSHLGHVTTPASHIGHATTTDSHLSHMTTLSSHHVTVTDSHLGILRPEARPTGINDRATLPRTLPRDHSNLPRPRHSEPRASLQGRVDQRRARKKRVMAPTPRFCEAREPEPWPGPGQVERSCASAGPAVAGVSNSVLDSKPGEWLFIATFFLFQILLHWLHAREK